jgi:SAM-dependent methyltransferase
MTDHGHLAPSLWIARFAHLIPPGARVLDLAAGEGRHARLFAARGAHVVAVDRDADVLATLSNVPRISVRVCDLESGAWPLSGERFDAIVVANYLHRPLFPYLRAALAPDGVLLYETFAMGNEAHGRPTNPDFLLCPDELLTIARRRPPRSRWWRSSRARSTMARAARCAAAGGIGPDRVAAGAGGAERAGTLASPAVRGSAPSRARTEYGKMAYLAQLFTC